jgi:hypothetical protein
VVFLVPALKLPKESNFSWYLFPRFCCAVLGGGVAAPGKQKAAMAGRRGVLRDIGNIGNVRVAEG